MRKRSTVMTRLAAAAALTGLAASALAPALADTQVAAQTSGAVDPGAFVTSLVEDLSGLARDSAANAEARLEGMGELISRSIAADRMKRFVLSSRHRDTASEAQLARYNEIFEAYISADMASNIDDLVSRRLEVSEVVTRRPGDYVVRSKLYSSSGRESASVDWRVFDEDGDVRLVDVMVDGVSFNVERRAQFSALVNNEGFDALLAHMEEFLVEES